MDDLEAATDFKINEAVARSRGHVTRPQILKHDFVFVEADFDIGREGLNYCSYPEDAWPVIVDNKISLHAELDPSINLWSAQRVVDGLLMRRVNENPLRAAMELYLMMETIRGGL